MSDGAPAAAPRVLHAFAAAGLWPQFPRKLASGLATAGVHTADDVSAARLAALPGVAPGRAERLVSSFHAAGDTFDVVALLVPAGLDARVAGRVVTAVGPGAATALRLDPWRLLEAEGTTLDDADRLARAVLDGPSPPAAAARGRALVVWVLRRAAREGHTAQPLTSVLAALTELGTDAAVAVEAAVEDGRVLVDAEAPGGTLLTLERYAVAEDGVAGGLARLLATAEPLRAAGTLDGAGLDATQQAAVARALRSGVSLLTGGPGTGKSRTVAVLVGAARGAGARVALAAPTGRAAKRLEEIAASADGAGDAQASTVHRLLGAQGTSGEFLRGEEWPLDADLVVVDEVSMLDAELASALVEACADGTHLLLVGDPAQLPSIGAGRVLADLLQAAADGVPLPVTELSTLYRQAEGGAIARLATGVRAGELPAPPPPEETMFEVVVVPSRGAEEAAHRVVQLVTRSIPTRLGISPGDVQVVTPVHRGAAGTTALNVALKAVLNPGRGEHSGFDVGDRVVATANHLELGSGEDTGRGFANGEVGVVVGVAAGPRGTGSAGHSSGLTVAFAGGRVDVPVGALGDLTHGWAVTVHRAQGSEWPGVVVVLPPESGGLLARPLVYTAFTRAQRHLSVVNAVGPGLARAVAQVRARPRVTRLAALLAAEVGVGPGLGSGE